jgi:outer membrane receptor protein involved in Fe transport
MMSSHAFRSLLFFLALVALLPASSNPAHGGTIAGTITDARGDAAAAALVTVEALNMSAVTDGRGSYAIEGVPAGRHMVSIALNGHRTRWTNVEVAVGTTSLTDIALTPDIAQLDHTTAVGLTRPHRKLETSFATTTRNRQQIEEKAPLSTADLLGTVPGYWSESSAGEVVNNLFARGLPQDGSFRYVTLHEDGLPIFEAPELAFTGIDLLMRLDETVSSMTAVRGGLASVLASNAPGGVVDFATKTGGDTAHGLTKLTVGDYGLYRTDFAYGGPAGDDLRFHVGGFYRFDNGIRDPDYPANRGGQIKANVTRPLETGYLRISGKYLNDRNIVYLSIPLQDPGDPSGITGVDPNSGTLATNDAAAVRIPTPDEGALTPNLKDGFHPELVSVGGELLSELAGGWTIRGAFRYTNVDFTGNAIFSLGNPADATLFAVDRVSATPGAADYEYSYAHSPGEAFDPASANGNGLVIESGWWNVEKPLRNFVNDMRLTKQAGDHVVTAGVYFSDYSADERWLFNNVLTEVRDAPRLLELELLDAIGDPLISVTDNGFTRYGTLYRRASSDAYLVAIYLSDEWQVGDRLRVDGGVRYEDASFRGSVEELVSSDLGDASTQADDAVLWGSGDFRPYDWDFDEVAWSVGLNYGVRRDLAVYGRVSDGFRMPDFEQWTGGNVDRSGRVEEILQLEGGVAYAASRLGLSANVFYSRLDGVPFDDEVTGPGGGFPTLVRRYAETTSIGLEMELGAAITRNVQVDLIGTIQQPEFDDFRFTFGGNEIDYTGNQLRRIPELLLTFRPSYQSGRLRAFASYQYVDDRFVDTANNVILPSYDVIDAGIIVDVDQSLSLQLSGNNLANTIGLTEGNPIPAQIPGISEEIYMARPILGRSVRVAATHRF